MSRPEQRFRSVISFVWLLGLVVTLLMAGCGSNGGDAQPGVLAVALTDAPACGYDKVNITVSKVRVHQSDAANEHGGGWSEITLDPPRKINLLDLNDPTQPNVALEHLGETPLPAGHYTQLRLVLAANSHNPNSPLANSVVLLGEAMERPLETPSGIQSGIKLIHPFTVGSGEHVDLLLDFDACHSVVKRGTGAYALKPVIKVIPFVLNGIQGVLDAALFPGAANPHLVMVSAQVNGDIVRSAVPNAATGKFYLARLDPASYDVVITADGHATTIIAGVPVTSPTSTTTLSTEAAPFSLETSPVQTVSGTVLLNPATDDEPVFIAAKQTVPSGPTITVHSQPAVVVDGPPPGDSTYSLALPSNAPWLASYSAALPIVPSVQPAVAGQYTVMASAEGYSSQSSAVDISAGSAIRDFTLIP